MKREWHFNSNQFMDWVREEFPEPLSYHFTYEMLENIIGWIANRCETTEEFLISITNIVPEVTREEWERFLCSPNKN